MTERPSLRERRRQETRRAISWAAIALAVDRGLGNVTIDDIAGEAGVSPRTVNNYFSSKAEAIVARQYDRAQGIADHLRARPADEPLWTALRQAAVGQHQEDREGDSAPPDPQWTEGVRLMLTEPALQGEFLKAGAATEQALTQAVAERLGADPDRDLRPLLIATAAGGAVRAAMAQWLRADPPVPFDTVLHQAFDQLAEVLP
ncbi:acyl-CoA-like ligand-binding transcription factor [Amycolatopsis jiangsuensis]|uniref:AcrR family transcriptional regulator n=1 Tax=Amycolatopsis jiangsuensis TaxID=1181879 RepID=A0A840J4K5_9PSEU|nr:TetR family transcriptional regulator [Amycolatopsis jiangsuensis]MBB4688980.1 AcrR family transcriptional regulator [Amycolatopsis jiangsuensis]